MSSYGNLVSNGKMKTLMLLTFCCLVSGCYGIQCYQCDSLNYADCHVTQCPGKSCQTRSMINGMVSHMCGDPNGKKGCIDEFGAQICTCTDDKCNAPNFNATSSGGYGNSGNSWGSGFNSGGSGSMNGQQGSGSNTWGSWVNGNNGGSGSGWENWGGNQGNEWGKQFSGGNGKDGFHKCENGTNCYNASTAGSFVSLNLVCCAIYIAMWL